MIGTWHLIFRMMIGSGLISINSQYLLDFADDYLTPSILGVGVSAKRNNMSYMASVSDKFGDSDWTWGLSNVISSNNDLILVQQLLIGTLMISGKLLLAVLISMLKIIVLLLH